MNLVQLVKSLFKRLRDSGGLDKIIVGSVPTPTSSFELRGNPTEQERSRHRYLFHVTDISRAECIAAQQKLFGCFPWATLGQDLRQCLKQAERHGCALIFEWAGKHQVGYTPPKLKAGVAYHHVEPVGYIETFVAKGSTQLELVAVVFAGDSQRYSTAQVLKDPIKVRVGADDRGG